MLTSQFKSPDESPGYLLWRVSSAWRRDIEAALKPLGLTHPQFVVLASTAWLTRNGERVTQAAIGRQAGLDPNTTSQILRSLDRKGWIERARRIDERSKNPCLSETGLDLLKEALPLVEEADNAFFSTQRDEHEKLKAFL